MARKVAHPVSIRLEEDLLRRLDKLSKETRQTRSRIIYDAIVHYAGGLEDGTIKTGDLSAINDDLAAIKQRLTLVEHAVAAHSLIPAEARYVRSPDGMSGSILFPGDDGYDEAEQRQQNGSSE